MTKPLLLISLAGIIAVASLTAEVAYAGSISRSTTSILNFQQRMADKGNAKAQYKLGSMYELGVGAEKDLVLASALYTKAYEQGSLESKERLTYLQVRKEGFDEKRHADWLKKLKKAAGSGNQHAAMLLGQIYSYGLGVEKDLDESIRLLNLAGVYENPVVVYEVERVEKERELLAEPLRQQKKERRREINSNKIQQAAIPVNKIMPDVRVEADVMARQLREAEVVAEKRQKAKQMAEQKAKEIAAQKAEKRRRYDEVMRKIKEEESIIDAQQAWAEGH